MEHLLIFLQEDGLDVKVKKNREIYCKKFVKSHTFFVIYSGSGPTYGGYPCSLWTLWHVLTVNQDKDETPPSKVISLLDKTPN